MEQQTHGSLRTGRQVPVETRGGEAAAVERQSPALGPPYHPESELVDRVPAGSLQKHGVDEIGAGLEGARAAAEITVQPGKHGRDRGLALARGGRRDEERGAAPGPVQSSIPFCARLRWRSS